MAKIDWTFVDEVGTNLNRYIATDGDSGVTYDFFLTRNAEISQVGTSLNASNLNQLISSINTLYDKTSTIDTSINTINNNITNINSNITTINNKFSSYVPITRTINGKELSSNISITKSDVGLGNVDNTSDVNKPISNATQTELNKKANDSDVVKLTNSQTISGAKTFTGVQKFTGESRFSNSEYCPDDSITDIANGIGKSSLFARSMTLHTITGQIIAPNVNYTNDTYGYNSIKDTIKIQYVSSYTPEKITSVDIATFSPNEIIFNPNEEFTVNIHGEDVALFTIYGLDLNNGNITSVNNINTKLINNGTPLVTSNSPLISDSNVVLSNTSLIYQGSNVSTTIKLNNRLSTFRLLECDFLKDVLFTVSGDTLGSSSITITITNVSKPGNYTINFYVYDIFGTKVTKTLTVSKL